MRTWVTILLTVAVAFAVPRTAPAAPDAARSVEERVASAETLFKAGDYAAAARELEQAYAASPSRRLLVGWAQAEKYAGNCKKSLELYERFLSEDPTQAEIDAVASYIDECRAQIEASGESGSVPGPPTSPEVETVETPSDDPGSSPVLDTAGSEDVPPSTDGPRRWFRDPLGGALVGVGAAFTLAGAGLAIAATVEDGRVDNIRRHGDFQDGLDRALLEARLSYGAFAIGGALLIGGAVRYAVVARRGKRNRSVAVLPSASGIIVRGRF